MKIIKHGIILEKTAFEFENEAVSNPAVYLEGNTVHMFYRAVKQGNFSSIGYCAFSGPANLVYRSEVPLLIPSEPSDVHGVEDPRIVKIDELFYLTYTAYDGTNALGAWATSTDLKSFRKNGILVPQITNEEFLRATTRTPRKRMIHRSNGLAPRHEISRNTMLTDKNLVFFPRKIQGKFYFLHRIRPNIQIASVNHPAEVNAQFWETYLSSFERHILLSPVHEHEINYVGAGCPPIETSVGWVLIYHGVHRTDHGFVYTACAALLDLLRPQKVIARLPYPLFIPDQPWETDGIVNNVVFPTGTALFGDILYIYYGAADSQIGLASVSIAVLINELLKYPS